MHSTKRRAQTAEQNFRVPKPKPQRSTTCNAPKSTAIRLGFLKGRVEDRHFLGGLRVEALHDRLETIAMVSGSSLKPKTRLTYMKCCVSEETSVRSQYTTRDHSKLIYAEHFDFSFLNYQPLPTTPTHKKISFTVYVQD